MIILCIAIKNEIDKNNKKTNHYGMKKEEGSFTEMAITENGRFKHSYRFGN